LRAAEDHPNVYCSTQMIASRDANVREAGSSV
jgi:hypothetical protein